MNDIKTILFDSDGVIVPNSPQMFLDLTHEIINHHNFLARETILQYFRSVISFSPWDAIQFFLGELNLKHLIPEIRNSYQNIITDNPNFESYIDKEFFPFIQKLNLNGIEWKIVSLGATSHLSKIDAIKPENIYNLNSQSKANPQTYKTLIEVLKVKPDECILVDDGILSIRAAKMNGIRTIFMQNNFYGTQEQYEDYKAFVDFRVFNFEELSQYLSKYLNI